MSQPLTYQHTISGLIHKRKELFQEFETATQRIATVKNDISAVDRVLKSLGFEGDINAHMTKPRAITVMRRGDVMQTIKEELRNATEPLHSREIALTLITLRGMDHRDKKYAETTRRSVSKYLRQLRASGMARCITDEKNEMRWVWVGRKQISG